MSCHPTVAGHHVDWKENAESQTVKKTGDLIAELTASAFLSFEYPPARPQQKPACQEIP